MAKIKYAYQGKTENTARVMGRDLSISTKEAYEVANAVKGKKISKAKALLEDVLDKKRSIPFKRYNKRVPHRKEGASGRYPFNTSSAFLNLLEELEANAESQGLNKERLVVIHAATHNGGFSRGNYKGSPQNTPITHIELVAEEVSGKSGKKSKKKSKKKPKKESKKSKKKSKKKDSKSKKKSNSKKKKSKKEK
ncbi:MAG: 50S ribosomal protein L22, partial [Candidatus Undinarchaeales archaeon]